MTNWNQITIYCDGSVTKNPGGVGGWAYLIVRDGYPDLLVSGQVPDSTNNQMELRAINEALERVRAEGWGMAPILIRSDSEWALRGCQGLNKRKANVDLFDQYDRLSSGLDLRLEWVRGHNGDWGNEIVDRAARAAAFGTEPKSP